MPYINSTEFGSITIDDIKYNQVLIVGNKVIEREYKKLKELFGTSHKIGEWEVVELLKENPEAVFIGTGQDGMLSVDKNIIEIMKGKGIELVIEKTPVIITLYNNNLKIGKKVNALIHTTC